MDMVLVPTVLSTVIATFASKLKIDGDTFDFYNTYYRFPEEYTDLIDELLVSKRGYVTTKIIVGRDAYLPDIGKHYFYYYENADKFFSRSFVTLEKFKETENERTIHYYKLYVRPFREGTFNLFMNSLFSSTQDRIRVISIDTSVSTPRLIYVNKICPTAEQSNQREIIDNIMKGYNNSEGKNFKVIISGSRGIGKTTIAKLLVKRLESQMGIFGTRLYDDFNPCAVGVNVKYLVSRYSSTGTPIILVINEIDVAYAHTLENKHSFDPRLLHTQNKQTFNDMLDAIADTPDLIAIYTTEKSKKELMSNEDYRSYMRIGRVDAHIEMTML